VTVPVQVGPATITINRDDRVVVCQPDGSILGSAEDGFFARDTRFLSGYALRVNGATPTLLNAAPIRFFSARYEMTNESMLDRDGPIARHSLAIRLDRTISGGVHEDLDIVNYARRPVHLVIEIQLTSDFADIFDVKGGGVVRRGTIDTAWYSSRQELRTVYVNGSFRRELIVTVPRSDARAQYANGQLLFVADIPPKGVWHACTTWLPITRAGSQRRPDVLPCNAVEVPFRLAGVDRLPAVAIRTTNDTVRRAWSQAVGDLEALHLEDPTFERGVYVPAAGVPWFLTLFGRDTLIVSMQTISGYPEFADGALRRLGALQATADDPARDMEPGKIPHEIRHGELAQTGVRPFTPYYGTHDATTLYVSVLSYLHQWVGHEGPLRRHLESAEAALRWARESGDRDGDGFQEYATRSAYGYYNQGWKDAGDAVPHEDGSLAPLPIALCEHQGYLFDATLRMADIYELLGRDADAARLRAEAASMFDRFNDAFWWEEEGTYYLGLDGEKRPIRSVASNAGHLLQSGIVPADRAGRVVERLLREDMWSGWGIRTLSSDHVAYNPFSYHTGTVWPHDNAVIAGGFRRYGYAAEAAKVARGMFDAAERLPQFRLPELFAGLPRHEASFPVQYPGANVPQAWAASAILRLVAVLAGIHARTDGKGSTIYVDPALPPWLPDLAISNLRAGKGAVSITLVDGTLEVTSNTTGFDVRHGAPPRVLGRPGGG
jgi:glycogen debranching enzyme